MGIGKGTGRGGARKGAGRPKKPGQEQKVSSEPALKPNAQAQAEKTQIDITTAAQRAALKGVKKLEIIAQHGSEAGAVKATKLLLEWGFVSPAVAKGIAAADRYRPGQPAPVERPAPKAPEPGVKEVRKANAEKATADGTFAVPSPPRLAVDNSGRS